jgi:hypothetical protein
MTHVILRSVPNSMQLLHTLAALAIAIAGLALGVGDVLACACCTNQGQRRVGVEQLDSGKRDELSRLRFGPVAQLFAGERDPADIKGIATPSDRYELRVSQAGNRWTFEFRDKGGRSGTLSLSLPSTVSIFEVDPRDEPDRGHGPSLYKEWKLTSKAAGTGIFAPSMGNEQRITLIMQGRGNSCTSADHFGHWTLVESGPKGDYSLFGELVR